MTMIRRLTIIAATWFFAICNVHLTFQQQQQDDDGHEHPSPKFLSSESLHEVDVGQNVELECRVANLGNYAVMWSKESESGEVALIADHEVVFSGDDADRFEILNASPNNSHNFDFRIREVRPDDQAYYICRVISEPEIFQKHLLIVKERPWVNIVPEMNSITVKLGQPITLSCIAHGNPVPTLSWTKIGSLLPDGQRESVGHMLSVKKSAIGDAGTYRCIGTNKDAQHHADISVHVTFSAAEESKYKPIVNTSKNIIFVRRGQSFNISCSYSSNPKSRLQWFHGSVDIQDEKYRNRTKIVEVESDDDDVFVSTLTVYDVIKSDTGSYKCRATNNEDQEEAFIEVSDVAGPPKIKIREVLDSYPIVTWEIESPEPVLNFTLEYHTILQDKAENVITIQTDGKENADSIYKGSYVLDSLAPNQEYNIIIRGISVNGVGKSPQPPISYKTGPNYKPVDKDKEQSEKDSAGKPIQAANEIRFSGQVLLFTFMLIYVFQIL